MRVKIITNIIENGNPKKCNYKHELYSMVLANLPISKATEIHQKKRFKRLFTFTDVFIQDKQLHFYISGEDQLIKDFINCIMFNQLVKLGDKTLNVVSIQPLNDLIEKKEYTFKTNLIVNEMENGKVCLSNNFNYITERIGVIATEKHNQINNTNLENNLKIEIIKAEKIYNRYKNHHLNAWRCNIKVNGDYSIIKTMFNVGIGENTASGHGFAWEV